MADENWTNYFSTETPLTLEEIERVLSQMSQKKTEVRIHPGDAIIFRDYVARAWPAGQEAVAGFLAGEVDAAQAMTRLDVALRGLVTYSEHVPRGKAIVLHWIFREAAWLFWKPKWGLPMAPGGPKTWQIEKMEIMQFYGDEGETG